MSKRYDEFYAQDAKLFRVLEFPTSDCKSFEQYRVPGVNGKYLYVVLGSFDLSKFVRNG